jgi:hypothetical protein
MADDQQPKDWPKIRDAGYAAKLAYVYSHPEKYADQKELVEALNKNLAGYRFQEVRKDNAYVLLATPPTNDKPAFIAFAGSDDPWDWVGNFIGFPAISHHWNHAGFNAMYRHVNPPKDPVITRFIEHMEKQGVEIYTCGHSMGGALATLCAQEHGHKHALNVLALNNPSTGKKSTEQINEIKNIDSMEKLNISNFVKYGDFVSMGGTGSLPGDTYVIEDLPIGQSFIVTHVRMKTDLKSAVERFGKNVVGMLFPKHNPISAHSSENMLSYIEELAERNQPINSVMARISDEEIRPLLSAPKAPVPPGMNKQRSPN